MKTIISTLIATAAISLMGCNGQNPLKRESNPVKDYPELEASVQVEKLPPPKPEVPDAEQNPCLNRFDIGLDNSEGRVMIFQPGQNNKYILNVRSYAKGSFNLELKANAPKGMSLNKINSGKWHISWTPAKDLLQNSLSALNYPVTIKYVNPSSAALCGRSSQEVFNAVVIGRVSVPVVSVAEISQEAIEFGRLAKFKVVVSNASTSVEPQLDFGFNSQAFTGRETLNVQDAVACSSVKLSGTQWIFNCEFASASEKIKGLTKYIDSGKTVEARFDVQAVSDQTNSTTASGIFRVKFAKPITDIESDLVPEKTDKGVTP